MSEDVVSRTSRTRRTATSSLRRAVGLICSCAQHKNEHVRAFAGWEAAELLRGALSDLEDLASLVPDDLDWVLEEAQREAERLFKKLRDRRLAVKLAGVEGRTPEEAALFAAKAEELRHS